MKPLIVETPVYTVDGALAAAESGVDRLELCADYGEGGVTASAGMLGFLKSRLTIPVFAMIRPRGGDFVYGTDELSVMARDIGVLGSLGADGFVFGALTPAGEVDEAACAGLIAAAAGRPCTFHRAVDVAADPAEALEVIIRLGFRRVLTSGAADRVQDGLQLIASLHRIAAGRIIVMPGGGLEPQDVRSLIRLCDGAEALCEIHAGCRGYRPTLSTFSRASVRLSVDQLSSTRVLTVDPDRVRAFREVTS